MLSFIIVMCIAAWLGLLVWVYCLVQELRVACTPLTDAQQALHDSALEQADREGKVW